MDRLYPGSAVQTAGYELLLPKPLVPLSNTPGLYFNLQLRPDGSYKVSLPYEDPSDLDVFRAALITTIWKMNRGMVIESGSWSELDAVLSNSVAGCPFAVSDVRSRTLPWELIRWPFTVSSCVSRSSSSAALGVP